MSRELICVHVGHSGARIGDATWALALLEHGLGGDGMEAAAPGGGGACVGNGAGAAPESRHVLFDVTAAGKHVPRCLFLDMEPDAALELRGGGARASLYHPARCASPAAGAAPSGGVFAAAACSAAGRAVAADAADALRALAERCDALDGLHITMSPAGGAGAGLGSLLLQELELELGRASTLVHALFPSPLHAAPPLEAYNAVLSLRALTDSADVVSVFDNGALSLRCAAAAGLPLPAWRGGLQCCDAAAGAAAACLCAPARLGGTPRGGIAALAADIAPYPRLHFAAPALSALCPGGASAASYQSLRPRDVAAAALSPSAALACADAGAPGAATLAAVLTWRCAGDDAADVTAAAAAARASAAAPRPADWAPPGPALYLTPAVMPSYPGAPFAALPRSALALVNSSAFECVTLASLARGFDGAFASRAHVARYASEGLEAIALAEAREDLANLAAEYAAAAADTVPAGLVPPRPPPHHGEADAAAAREDAPWEAPA